MAEGILRVNIEKGEISYEDVPEDLQKLGGRAVTSSIVADEVPSNCHPLGPNNKLVLAPGIVTGTSAPSSGRMSAGAKSPLTGGIKESNVGSRFAQTMAKLGLKAIIVEGMPEDGYKLLHISQEDAKFLDASKLSNIGLYEAYEKIHDEFGDKVDICSAGIAGEMKASNAGLCFNDIDGLSSRYAGRGGLGAVMASRGLKFIVLDGKGASGVEIKDKEMFERGKKKLVKGLKEHDVTKPGGALSSFGTNVLINILDESGGLPHRNFSAGSDENAEKVSGEKKADMIKELGGVRPHVCSPGCIIQCSEVWTKKGGKDPVGVLEYESVWALGPNCGIYDLKIIGELNRACNDLGLDTIEMGNTIAVAMEGGMLEFGDGKGALKLMDEIRKKTHTGRLLANGADLVGKALGVYRVPTVKGQSIPAYDPRAVKGIGTTYATTTMGADHTAGYTVATEILSVGGESDPLDPSDKAELSKNFQIHAGFIDSSGYCLFTTFATLDDPETMEGMAETIGGVIGEEFTVEDMEKMGKQVLAIERKFNKEAGFTDKDDRLPEFMREEPLPPHNEVYDVSDEELDMIHED